MLDKLLDRSANVDLTAMRQLLSPLVESEDELRAIASHLGAKPSALFFGQAASETTVKGARLDRFSTSRSRPTACSLAKPRCSPAASPSRRSR
jgi:hypothetical protein